MSEIIPAILPKNFEELEEKIALVSGKVRMVHVDVTNDTLAPGSTWPYAGDAREFDMITNEIEGFPFWEQVSFEAHLMVQHPEEIAEDWIRAGAERLTLHIESFDDDSEAFRLFSLLKNQFVQNSAHLGVEVGLAINLDTPLERSIPFLPLVDFVHLMSIKNIGVQGNPFDDRVFERIELLKQEFPNTIISVDGGITQNTLGELIESGASRLVVGSAIYGAEDPEEALDDLLELTEDHAY